MSLRKWSVYIIIGVLTIALFGLIIVQSVYIRRGLYIQEQVFNQIVSEAMGRTAMSIEQQEAANFFNAPQNLNQFIQQESAYSQDPFDEHIAVEFVNGVYYADIEFNDSIYSFQADNLAYLDSLVQYAGLDICLLPSQNMSEDAFFEEYNSVFQNMAAQFMYTPPSNELPMDSHQIERLLDFELERSGIDTKFEFAILDGYTLDIVVSNFKDFSPDVLSKAYSMHLHLNSFYGNEALLLLNFPKKRSFIMKSNNGLLFSSFLFIVLIAGSFGASIFVIFKQKKLSALKTDFINNMTHELKTPVATISLATEMLAKEKVRVDQLKVKNYSAIISDENKRLGDHIEKVLQIAQLDKEELKLKKEELDIHILLKEVIDKFKLRIDDANASIILSFLAINTIVSVDKTHFINVFSNLLDNALKYRREVPLEIEISTSQSADGSIAIQIKDNGIGMNIANQKKIFTRFYRVPTGNIHNVKGFGLGLSYVKTMVEAHSGKIEVDSRLNQYTAFTITLPTLNS